MPGSIASASPATVLPENLCSAFTHSRSYRCLINEYPSGETQREKFTETSRKRWSLTRNLGKLSGTVNTSGTTISWQSGQQFEFAWAGCNITINGSAYEVDSVESATSLTLTETAGTQTGVTFYVWAADVLRAFYLARDGPMEPFWYYDPWDASPKFSYDPTGASATGRYTVRFDSPWTESTGLARTQVQLELVEVA